MDRPRRRAETFDRSDAADHLHGGPGDDELRGYAGSDVVSGDEGDDRLNGWLGSSEPEPPDAVNDVEGGDGTDACARAEPSHDRFSDCEHFPPYVPY